MAEVPRAFTPRRASGRRYRYFLDSKDMEISRLEDCASVFQGRHDFRRFCKADGRSTIKELRSVTVQPVGDLIVIALEAREFLRNMVRRVVAAINLAANIISSLVHHCLLAMDFLEKVVFQGRYEFLHYANGHR